MKMNKTKLLTGLVIIMVVINLLLLSFLWVSRPEDRITHRSRNKHQRVENYLSRQLELTNDQTKAFEEQRKEHFKATRAIFKDIQRDKKKMIEMLSSGADSISIERVLTDINKKNKKLERLNFWHIKKLRDICSEDQKKKFDKIIYKIGEPPANRLRMRKGS